MSLCMLTTAAMVKTYLDSDIVLMNAADKIDQLSPSIRQVELEPTFLIASALSMVTWSSVWSRYSIPKSKYLMSRSR